MIAITQAVGEARKALPKDQIAVEGALRAAGMLPLVGPISDLGLVAAIRAFQAAVGISPDGRIDPGGGSLKALNAITDGLTIGTITPQRVANGGYKIPVGPVLPKNTFRVLLGFSPIESDCIDITGANKADVLNADRFDKLITIIHRLNKWGTDAQLKAYLYLNGKLLSTSLPATIKCPVPPHNGKFLPLDETNNGPALKYLGDSEKGPFYGRLLHKHSSGIFLFIYAGIPETDPKKRGFDCITYAGAVTGAEHKHMADSADLASSLGASIVTFEIPDDTPAKPAPKPAAGAATTATATATATAPAPPKMKTVNLDNADPSLVKQYFATSRPERYLLWTGGHIVVIDNNTVHEFSYSKGGYKTTAIATWLEPYKTTKLNVRKL